MAVTRRVKVHVVQLDQEEGVVSKEIHQGAVMLGVAWAGNRCGIITAEDESQPLVTRSVRIVRNGDQVVGNPGTLIGHVVNNRGHDSNAFVMVFLDLGES